MAALPVSELALGSILHVVQDSFAAGHARRVHSASAGCPDGRIVQFHAHFGQIGARHADHDSRRALVERDGEARGATQNAVEASARMLLFARARADWATAVEPYLRRRLFCVDGDGESAGPGGF